MPRFRHLPVGAYVYMELADSKIAKEIADSNVGAFNTLFFIYYPKVKRFVASLLKDETTAEDLSQDIFERIWLHRVEFSKVENLNAFLYRAARNAVFQYLRHTLVVNEYFRDFSNDSEPQSDSTDDQYIADDIMRLIQLTVDSMPQQRKKAYTLSRNEGKKNDEIALIMGIEKRTVENHITRALADIRQMLRNLYTF